MENDLQFARIINPVCSCGNYVGRLQHFIEFKLIELNKEQTNDEDISYILTNMGIHRMCCRREIIVSPVLRLLKIGNTFNIYQDKKKISETFSRLIVGNKKGPRIYSNIF